MIELADVSADRSGVTEGEAATRDFASAYATFYPVAFKWALALTGDENGAADVVQDAFIRIFSKERQLRDEQAFKSYLRRTVVRTATSRWRAESRWRRRTERAADEAGFISPAFDVDPELVAAVRALPGRQQAVVVMRFWLDWSEQDIADALRCRPGTVKSLSSRALDSLRREVER